MGTSWVLSQTPPLLRTWELCEQPQNQLSSIRHESWNSALSHVKATERSNFDSGSLCPQNSRLRSNGMRQSFPCLATKGRHHHPSKSSERSSFPGCQDFLTLLKRQKVEQIASFYFPSTEGMLVAHKLLKVHYKSNAFDFSNKDFIHYFTFSSSREGRSKNWKYSTHIYLEKKLTQRSLCRVSLILWPITRTEQLCSGFSVPRGHTGMVPSFSTAELWQSLEAPHLPCGKPTGSTGCYVTAASSRVVNDVSIYKFAEGF